jgi:hypothetical protein
MVDLFGDLLLTERGLGELGIGSHNLNSLYIGLHGAPNHIRALAYQSLGSHQTNMLKLSLLHRPYSLQGFSAT